MALNQSAATAERAAERHVSDPPADSRCAGDAATFGAFLRREREARRLTLQEIANVTKIGTRHFSALERGDIREWPGGFYRRAMIRAYAGAIGLDTDELVRTFIEIFPEEHDHGGPSVPSAPRIGTHGGAVVRPAALCTGLVGAVVVAVLLMTWSRPQLPPVADRTVGTGGSTLDRGRNKESEVVRVTSPVPPAALSVNAHESRPAAAMPETTPEKLGAITSIEGGLRVVSDPAGAQVTVNGIGWGRTPVAIKYLPMGKKRVRLTMDGYRSAEREIEITVDRPVRSLQLRLEAQSAPSSSRRSF